MILFSLSLVSLTLWTIILLLPWRPWQTKESWDVRQTNTSGNYNLEDVSVIIPARNEQAVIAKSLEALKGQGAGLEIIVVDDNSTDETAAVVQGEYLDSGQSIRLIEGKPRPAGWTGKLWALEQGRKAARRPVILLLDADIKLQAGVIRGLRDRLAHEETDFVSLMAMPSLDSFWQKLIMPTFIYFFKLLYPFQVANSESPRVAAAAGGCIMTKRTVLEDIGGFGALKDALIDDCMLARHVKNGGYRLWLGLTHSIQSIRPNQKATALLNMIARSAFAQLKYSTLLLLVCTATMVLAYWVPLMGLFFVASGLFYVALAASGLMMITYFPTVKYYNLLLGWSLLLPFSATLFLLMTWVSAFRYWTGERMRWRGRILENKI